MQYSNFMFLWFTSYPWYPFEVLMGDRATIGLSVSIWHMYGHYSVVVLGGILVLAAQSPSPSPSPSSLEPMPKTIVSISSFAAISCKSIYVYVWGWYDHDFNWGNADKCPCLCWCGLIISWISLLFGWYMLDIDIEYWSISGWYQYRRPFFFSFLSW